MTMRMRRLLRLRYFLLVLCVLYALLLIPTPYAVYEPGLAVPVESMVTVEGEGGGRGEGELLLTTVKLTYTTNVVKWMVARFSPHMEIYRKADLFPEGEDREQYVQRQGVNMLRSQSEAIMAAYDLLGIAYALQPVGVVAAAVQEGSPAQGVVQPGDRIVAANGRDVVSLDDLAELVESGRIGEAVSLALRRGDELREATLAFGDIDPSDGRAAPGLGLSVIELRDVVPDDPKAHVDIAAGAIGGPSAGLMFALEIVDRLGALDLTRGGVIAGTGTIARSGAVGAIGGVGQKVVAAHRRGADVFLSPADNAEEARAKAREIGTHMTIVPVETLSDAVEFLTAREAG